MMWIIMLLAAHSVCFGLQHKVAFIHGKLSFLDKMLSCTYCTGFHAGWIVYLATWIPAFSETSITMNILQCVVFAFASASFSYFFDEVISTLESK